MNLVNENFSIVYYFCHLVFEFVSDFEFFASSLILVKNPVFCTIIAFLKFLSRLNWPFFLAGGWAEHRHLIPYVPFNILSDIGIVIQKVVPFPGRLEMLILPPIASMILYAIANPKPVPVDLVVK